MAWELLLWFLITAAAQTPQAPHVCVWHDKDSFFDLSPLTVDVGTGYVATSRDGGMPYYFNFCAATGLGGCEPGAAVCQVGAGTYQCGKVSDVSFSKFDNGVKLKYGGGEPCGGGPRTTTINVHCDKNATSLRMGYADEVRDCQYEIDVYSIYGCAQPLSQTPSVPVNIYLVVHSHDDVGWLKTFDEYYSIDVKNIIENIVTALSKNSSRKFIQVEQAYFSRWWDKAKDDSKWHDLVVKLVQNNQLSFTIGGWVMPDEATPSYTSIITQLTEGHQYLKKHFNFTPDVSWQIDPFGASSVVAEIYSETGFKGHVIDRINFMEKMTMVTDHALQFYWKYSKKDKKILTHVLDSNYCYPFRAGLKAPAKKTDEQIVAYAHLIVDTARLKARSLLTPNVMLPVGCDFAYTSSTEADNQYDSIDRAIEYILAHKEEFNVGIIQYSNVSDYFTALHESSANFPTPTDKTDFFPYNDANNSYWTGYYTTAPVLKGLIRQSEAVLRASELLYSTTLISEQKIYDETTRSHIDQLTRAISVNLHHDAITGTANEQVVHNYNNLLNNAVPPNADFIASTLSSISTGWKDNSSLVLNSEIEFSKVVPVVIYNSLPWIRNDYVQISLTNYDPKLSYSVANGQATVKSQIVSNLTGNGENALFFKVELPPLGFNTYYISSTAAKDPSPQHALNTSISNQKLKVTFSNTNTIDNVTFNSATTPFHQLFMMYESYSPKGQHEQESGPYVFRSEGEAYPVDKSGFASSALNSGEFLSDVYQTFNCSDSDESFVKQHVRIFHDDDEFLGNFIELSQTIGPLPKLGKGRELITRFISPVAANTSHTDSNGLRFLRRDYDPSLFLPIPGNYYPTVYASYIQNDKSAVGFIFDRAHGFSNGFDKTDIMLHRRIFGDDNKGVGHRTDDQSVIDPVIRLVFGSPNDIFKLIYKHVYLLNFPPVVAIGKPIEEKEKSKGVTSFSLLSKELPANVHLLDLKSTNTSTPGEYILRLTHLFETSEHESLSRDAELTMHDFFVNPFCITKLTETQLTATTGKRVINLNGKNLSVVLKPKQIITYIIEVKNGAEVDICSPNPCGKGKCAKSGCTYHCECASGYHFEPFEQKCVGDPSSFFGFIFQFPLAVLAHLSLVCAYAIRSEIKRLNRKEGAPKEENLGGITGRVRRFMRANMRVLERTFFPPSLARHQD
eukprot:Phypoly_transcript_00655.p1 GENE.Phypoly_transcript_00655~~Phypoly_transcript_00655.p1  ORF type:complete len:1185 (+),score=166.62 Phypoly_transcript_00655:676-4230(+)